MTVLPRGRRAAPRVVVALVAVTAMSMLLASCTSSGAGPDAATIAVASPVPELSSANGRLDVTLTAAESLVPYAGTERWAMTYNGGATGPTLRVRAGDTLTVTLVNELDEPTSLHTHGLHVSPTQDDPFAMVEPGHSAVLTYDIPADQQAGTYWYHPHVHGLTAEQVSSGLSGAILVEDDTDATLASFTTDRVLVINDPPLVRENPWRGSASGHGMGGMMGGDSSGVDMMTAMVGRTGPRLLTNGAAGVALPSSDGRLERVRVVNATASSTLALAYTGARMLVLSATGGRLPAPREITSVVVSPGDRTELVLVPGPDGGQLLAHRQSNEGDGRPVGPPELIATVAPNAGADTSLLPTAMSADTRDLFAPDVTVDRERVITLDGHMNPTIDGRPFDPSTVNITAAKGSVEEWVIRSTSPMAHPMHLHTWPFQVKGEAGWDDVVDVPAYGERVIRVAFDDFAGTTVLHCHILDHEDTGMMAVIRVA